MRRFNLSIVYLIIFLFINPLATFAETPVETDKEQVYYFTLQDEIFEGAWRKVKKAVEEAESKNASIFIMELNTYGGEVSVADSIRTKLLRMDIPTVVWINDNAASAGALISIACDSIFMSPGAKIGAATVVMGETGEAAPDKYQSYMRASMRATAEAQGRNPEIAEAMVDQDIEIEGIIDEGKTLTFTVSEAIKNDYCDGEIKSKKELLELLELDGSTIVEYQESTMDKIIGWLTSPYVSSMLILFMFGGLYFELQTPGVGFALGVAMIAAVLYFAPYYLEGLAENWEILLFIIGLGLLAVEVFVIPGFGVAGVTGLIFIVTSLTLSMVANDYFDFSAPNLPDSIPVSQSLFTVLASMLGAILAMFALGGSIFNSKAFNRVTLNTTQNASEGFTIADKTEEAMVGEKGVCLTDLRIAGRIKVNGEIFEAITQGGFIDKGQAVEIIDYKGNYFVVRAIEGA